MISSGKWVGNQGVWNPKKDNRVDLTRQTSDTLKGQGKNQKIGEGNKTEVTDSNLVQTKNQFEALTEDADPEDINMISEGHSETLQGEENMKGSKINQPGKYGKEQLQGNSNKEEDIGTTNVIPTMVDTALDDKAQQNSSHNKEEAIINTNVHSKKQVDGSTKIEETGDNSDNMHGVQCSTIPSKSDKGEDNNNNRTIFNISDQQSSKEWGEDPKEMTKDAQGKWEDRIVEVEETDEGETQDSLPVNSFDTTRTHNGGNERESLLSDGNKTQETTDIQEKKIDDEKGEPPDKSSNDLGGGMMKLTENNLVVNCSNTLKVCPQIEHSNTKEDPRDKLSAEKSNGKSAVKEKTSPITKLREIVSHKMTNKEIEKAEDNSSKTIG
ncbi:uncharacterized protein LOC132048882 [Lycium ferocissimum]|uniref:uncharacterized protein LOC132048882 n=1 Tax=Lycium ferocissimum TaxID=112874 RepID=UPI002814CAFB|nr:uncharacterized protein LOC132048882 [Lycium ferocissimum]